MANDVYEVRQIWDVAGEYAENVFHMQGAIPNSTTPADDASDLLTALDTATAGSLIPCIGDDTILVGYSARRVNNTGGPSAWNLTHHTGTGGSTSLPPSNGYLITAPYYDPDAATPRWRTSRMFIPGVPEDFYVAPNFTAGAISGISAYISAALEGVGAGPEGPWVYGAWSRRSSKFYTVTNPELQLLVGTIRKRLHPIL